MTELIITEKPSSAQKIAFALAEGKPFKQNENGVPYYLVTSGKKDIVVASAVGHLFTVAEKEKSKWTYPVYDIQWVESGDTKETKYVKKYIRLLKKLSKSADEFTVATDYDVEGEVIGMNVIRYICKKPDANRMKFSTLTKPDLIKSYNSKANTLDWGQGNAGETRHFLDWMYGINLSRALTLSIQHATGSFKLMSIGRVQGPALKIVVDREREILAFKPEPFWEIRLKGKYTDQDIEAFHKLDKIFDKAVVDRIMENVKGQKYGKVVDIKEKQFNQQPPVPFDLTTLQTECYRVHRIEPKQTLALAQDLYIAGVISYPRTSSQKLPPTLGYKNILTQLSRQDIYKPLADRLLALPNLKPNEGKKTDDAHPAIYPTGTTPVENITPRHIKVYDLIVKRFFATFAEPATRSTMTVQIEVNAEPFIAKGTRTVKPGWHVFYEPYVKLDEVELPKVGVGSTINIKRIKDLAKHTQPPKRYTPASIIKELEKQGLGTKATRSEIVDTLFRRNYVTGKSIQATGLGINLIGILEKYCDSIIDPKLTRKFEEDMEQIRKNIKTKDTTLEEAKKVLNMILDDFRSKEMDVGAALAAANTVTRMERNTVSKCPDCEGHLMIKKGKYGQFIACDRYPECRRTFKLPANAKVKTTDKFCETCNYPKIILVAGKRTQEVCINPNCSTKQNGEEAIPVEDEGKTCPKCGKGKLVLRSSMYGKFLGCSNYPKCKHIEKITQQRTSGEKS